MATRVVYGDTNDGYIQSLDATYSVASAGGGTLVLHVDEGQILFGQEFGGSFIIYQTFLAFNTTDISGVSSATLSLWLVLDNSAVDFTADARVFDWGDAVSTADWVPGSNLSSDTLLATISSAGVTVSAYNNFTDVSFPANINSSGETRMVIVSNDQVTGTPPAGTSLLQYADSTTSTPPKLTIIDSSTQGSQTLAGGTTTFTPTVTGIHDLDLWGGGSKVATSASAKSGAGGGAYSFAQYTVSSLSNVTVQVANTQTTNGTAGADSWFGSSSIPDPLAKGASGVSATTANSGGSSASGRGTIKFSGGQGAAAQGGGGSRGGSGAGSGAGTAAIGTNGSAGSGSAAGAGGTAPTGGGNGGTGGTGGGGAGVAGSVPGGGGGGGGSSSGANGNGAAGRIVVYWYVPAAPIIWIPPGLNSDALLRPFKVVAY